MWADTLLRQPHADEPPVRRLGPLFEHLLSLQSAPYSGAIAPSTSAVTDKPETTGSSEKRAFLSLFQDQGYSAQLRPVGSMPDDLLDLVYACLAPDCLRRPVMGTRCYFSQMKQEEGCCEHGTRERHGHGKEE